ncbi:hypothetical protein GCM10022215_22020 [Nocardioides fonticola]|uniref:Phospholipid/cholesterol/gamma-HCH transport system substrate-binding protein n=1 Tax=Nocardioides fonticola TaxID=450363 RepID=A0ABP7XIX8_9ACTN
MRPRFRLPTPVLGLVGTLVIVLVVLASINVGSLPLINGGRHLEAVFPEAGGLQAGDDVVVSGATVGKVDDLRIVGDTVHIGLTLHDEGLKLGDRTRARIVTVTLLGQAALELVPAGSGDVGGVIPRERTSSPYDVTSALNQLTTTTADIDVDQLAASLQQVSDTFADTPAEVRPALEGVSRLSAVLAENDTTLRRLLARASRVSEVLASRNGQVADLLQSGQQLLGELTARRQVVESLLVDATRVSRSVRSLAEENTDVLGPALDNLDRVITVLQRNKADLQAALDGVRNYATAFGEAVSTGPYFDAYIQNLTAPSSLTPYLSALQDGGAR